MKETPLISILMAIYEPKIDWLEEQLISLNKQTYTNLRLYIRDDCSKQVSYTIIENLVRTCVTSFPYIIERNDYNIGSNKTFEKMTEEAEGDYFAYCDQDDIWMPEKLSILVKYIKQPHVELVCSDMIIIDSCGKKIADSITEIRRRHVFQSGFGLTNTLWYSNFVSGCAMLVNANTAKASCPFNPYMYYDHYIAFFCANLGEIISLSDPLIFHREHGDNQSSTLQGINSKSSYKKIRIDNKAQQIYWLKDNFQCESNLNKILVAGSSWMKARQEYSNGDRSQWKTIWRYRRFGPLSTCLEIMLPFIPEKVFEVFLFMVKKYNL